MHVCEHPISLGYWQESSEKTVKDLNGFSDIREVAEHFCGWGVGVQENPDPSPQCGSPRREEAPSQGRTRVGCPGAGQRRRNGSLGLVHQLELHAPVVLVSSSEPLPRGPLPSLILLSSLLLKSDRC